MASPKTSHPVAKRDRAALRGMSRRHFPVPHGGTQGSDRRAKRPPIKVVIVDERPVIRAGIKAMLKAPDIRIVGEAGNAYQAVRLIGVRAPHVVVIGDRGHEPGGLDLIRRIKAKWPETAIIIVTATQSSAHVSRALALGCSACLTDWTARAELLKSVHAAARGEPVVEAPILKKLLEHVGREQLDTSLAGQLTLPERDVLSLIAEGQTNRDIAQRLSYSIGTVKDYVQKIIKKLQVSDRTQATVTAARLGLLD